MIAYICRCTCLLRSVRALGDAGTKNPSYYFKFVKPGGCIDTNCKCMHLDEAMVEEFKRAGKVL